MATEAAPSPTVRKKALRRPATLIAGLTSAGMPSTTAIAAVILFRLATFWIPLLPGWGALVVLQRSGDL